MSAHRVQAIAGELATLRRRMVDFAAVMIAFAAMTAAATAGSVRAWYYESNGYGSGNMIVDSLPGLPYGIPTDLGMCRNVAAGGGHFAAITRDNALRLWGNNDHGQLNLPEDFGEASAVSLGEYHTLALATDGYVAAWGNNLHGQTTVPYNLGTCSGVAAGGWHSLAIRANGSVRGWGLNDFGQRSIPADLGTVSTLSAGRYHSVALRTDGVVRAWGDMSAGVAEVNGRTGISQIAAGPKTTMLLRASDGMVEEFGSVSCMGLPTPCTGIPGGLPRFSAIAVATNARCAAWLPGEWNRSLVARTAGAWGGCWDDCSGNWRVPSFPSRVLRVVGSTIGGDFGTDCFLAILNDDCNDNGVADADEIASGAASDRNGNGIPDSCDVAAGTEEDCDHNGVIDSTQQQQNVSFYVESQQVGPIGYSSPRSIELAAPPYTLGFVNVSVTAFGDFSSSSEYLKIYLNGRWVGEVLSNGGFPQKNDCQMPTQGWLYIPRDFFNETIKSGGSTTAMFEVVPSIAVNANQCPSGSWVKLSLQYEAAVTEDCNANGLLDVCEITQVPDTDSDHNGIIDACQNYTLVFQCPGDLDGGGSVDTADLSLLLMSFGAAMPGDPADLDASGQIDTADLSLMLLSFGDC